jgi:hypothetical protein
MQTTIYPFIMLLFAAGMASCGSTVNKNTSATGLLQDSVFKAISIAKNIPCREGSSPAWVLDMALPANPAGRLRPAIVIVHGGGWSAGSKSDPVYQKLMLDYALKGYVKINVNYRLTGEAPFPACIEDVKCAVRWLRAHADKYQIDPNRIGGYGAKVCRFGRRRWLGCLFKPPEYGDCRFAANRIGTTVADGKKRVVANRLYIG